MAQGGDRPTVTELGWLESFLMTGEERRASIEAVTHGDREAFRRLFWMRRDPDPSTPRNETLDLYLARVRLADSSFSEDGGYGGGDRARIFVLLGMPVQVLPQPATEETPEGLLWVFPPEPENGLAGTLEARYLRDEVGQLWLENRTEVDESLEEMRRRLIARPEIGFERNEAGQLLIPTDPSRRGIGEGATGPREAGRRRSAGGWFFVPGDAGLLPGSGPGNLRGAALRNSRRGARPGDRRPARGFGVREDRFRRGRGPRQRRRRHLPARDRAHFHPVR